MTTTATHSFTKHPNEMSYETVLAGDLLQYMHITPSVFNSGKVWKS